MSETDYYIEVIDESELKAGSMKLVKVDSIPVLLIKAGEEIFAIDDRCPHMGCSLSGGSLDGEVIICPCHDWRFNLRTGEYEGGKEIKLPKYKMKIESGKIWIKIADHQE